MATETLPATEALLRQLELTTAAIEQLAAGMRCSLALVRGELARDAAPDPAPEAAPMPAAPVAIQWDEAPPPTFSQPADPTF